VADRPRRGSDGVDLEAVAHSAGFGRLTELEPLEHPGAEDRGRAPKLRDADVSRCLMQRYEVVI